MFEFDPAKSAANLEKHGIDFEEVQAVWADTRRLEIPARTLGEVRWALIGRIGLRHWTVIFTRRDDRLRLISARRARKEEVALYEEGFH
ncbi:BrnT family toxin [uncultured Amaricoccus sp.]|uniref:BrnT family toxin n=1 Tax=uncultured Amaricoccus sp. TaxID=339341 RepID=UPI00261D7FCB|nr:BrnT family toxin [uncultured Amaricoccus sp.]